MDYKSLIAIHLAVFLFGASGLFAKMIPLSALVMTLARALFSSIALYAFIHFRHYSLRLQRFQHYFWNILAGIFLTIHWFFFILSIQVSTVSIGTITFAIYPLFVTFIEPYVFKEKFQYQHLISVAMIIIGIAFLIPAFELNNDTTLGIIYGIISSFAYAILSVINRRLATMYESVVITLYEQVIVTLITTLLISIFDLPLGEGQLFDFINLMIYGIIFTGLAHSLYIRGLRGVKVQTASIISVLEPIYSIFLAMICLHERLAYQELIGTVFILLAVIIATILSQRRERRC